MFVKLPHQKSIKKYWKARQFCKADLLATARGSCQENILLWSGIITVSANPDELLE